jgi:hypothetical protein
MGNRGGRIHDPLTRSLGLRRWASKQWICCRLAFRGRARQVWGEGYTELFFCDEVTALAAGHRPCAECRRIEARAYQSALAEALGASSPSLADIDLRLHAERLDGRAQRRHRAPAHHLPDGAMIALGPEPHAILGCHALPWSHHGYGRPILRPKGTAEVLTSPTSLSALRGGYKPLWHPTAPS